MDARERSSVDASLGISRRTLLKRGAIVGGSLAWTVPVVHTLATPSASAGTPLDGISLLAVVLRSDDLHYRMKWEVVDGRLVGNAGHNFIIPRAPTQMMNYPNIQDGAAPGVLVRQVGEAIRITAPEESVLTDFVVKQGPCAIASGTYGMPSPGTTGPWLFNPLASPNC
jgi:hypothetical protein